MDSKMKIATIKVHPKDGQLLNDLYLSIRETTDRFEANHYLTTRIKVDINIIDNYVMVKSLNLEQSAN